MNSSGYISDFIEKKRKKRKTLSKRKVKQPSNPLITKGLGMSFRIKNKQYAFKDVYDVYINKICSLTRIRKQQYYFTAFDATNTKKTWEGIDNIIG